MHYIYLTTNLINNKKYIGQRAVQNYGIDKDKYLGSGTALINAINKYGRENFKKDILYICNTNKEADLLEILTIEKHNAVESDMFYNILDGGQFRRNKNHSEIVSKTMNNYYSDEVNYTNFMLKKNRIRYLKGLKPIEYTNIAQRDINKLKKQLQVENNKRNRIEKSKVLKLINKDCVKEIIIKTDEERKEIRSKAAIKAWKNESFRNTVVSKISAKNKERAKYAADNNIPLFNENHKLLLSKAKLEKSGNYFGLYLLELGIPNLKLLDKKISKVNTNVYKDNNNALKQIKNILNSVFELHGVNVDFNIALDNVNQTRRLKRKCLIISVVPPEPIF